MLIQFVFDIIGLLLVGWFLLWLWKKLFTNPEETSEVLTAKKKELELMRSRKEELENLVGVTAEVVELQKDIDKKGKELSKLEQKLQR